MAQKQKGSAPPEEQWGLSPLLLRLALLMV